MSTQSTPSLTLIEPTFGHALRVWWAWAWRVILLGFCIGFLIGFVGAFLGMPEIVGSSASGIGGLVLGIYVMRSILRKNFRHFRVCLVSQSQTPSATPLELEPTLGHAFQVWWAWAWRWTLWSLIVLLPVILVGGLSALAGLPESFGFYLGFVAGAVGPFLVSLYVLRGILRKAFGKFKICLVAHDY